MTAHPVDGIRCAQVEVDGTAVTLSFLGEPPHPESGSPHTSRSGRPPSRQT